MNERMWDKFLTERDKAVFAAGGFGARAGFGKRPVLLVIDVNWAFCGEQPEPILESIKRWRTSCGEESWVALEYIKSLIEAARAKGLPVIYTTGSDARTIGMPAVGVGRARVAMKRAVPSTMALTATKSSR
jgi:maleamate amidohydrolase